jgi:hypothetical protein
MAWVFLVAAHLGRAAGRVALDQEHLVEREVAALAVGQLAGQHGHARALALLDLLAGLLARLRLLDDQLGELLAVLDVLVQPQLQRRLGVRDTSRSASRLFRRSLIWPWNCGSSTLADSTKLARENTSSGISLTPLGMQIVQLDEALDRGEQAVRRPDSCVPPATVGIRLT